MDADRLVNIKRLISRDVLPRSSRKEGGSSGGSGVSLVSDMVGGKPGDQVAGAAWTSGPKLTSRLLRDENSASKLALQYRIKYMSD